MSEQTYTETVTSLRGDMREGFAEIKGEISTLTQAVTSLAAKSDSAIEDLKAGHLDHEIRMRKQESRSTVSPRQLWGVFTGVLALVIAAAGVVITALK